MHFSQLKRPLACGGLVLLCFWIDAISHGARVACTCNQAAGHHQQGTTNQDSHRFITGLKITEVEIQARPFAKARRLVSQPFFDWLGLNLSPHRARLHSPIATKQLADLFVRLLSVMHI